MFEPGLNKHATVALFVAGLLAAPISAKYGVLVMLTCLVLFATIVVYYAHSDSVADKNDDQDVIDPDSVEIETCENVQTQDSITPVVNSTIACRLVSDCPDIPSNPNRPSIRCTRGSFARPHHSHCTSLVPLHRYPNEGPLLNATFSSNAGHSSSSTPMKVYKTVTTWNDCNTAKGKKSISSTCSNGVLSNPMDNVTIQPSLPIPYIREKPSLNEKKTVRHSVLSTPAPNVRPLRKRKRAQQAEAEIPKNGELENDIESTKGKLALALKSQISDELPSKRVKEDSDSADMSKAGPRVLGIAKPQRMGDAMLGETHAGNGGNQTEAIEKFKNISGQTDDKNQEIEACPVLPLPPPDNVEKEDVSMADVESSDDIAIPAQTSLRIGVIADNDGLNFRIQEAGSPPSRPPTPSSCPTPSSYADEPSPSPSPMSMASSPSLMPALKLR